ncbi:hypothetical protein Tco_0847260 [Tanacetum coccineum]
MSTPIKTSTTDSQMHNNIMTPGSRDHLPILAMGRYAQWQSYFLRYIDTRPTGDALRKCILQGPYTPSTVTIPVVHATGNTPAILEQTTVETILNMSPKNKSHYESEKEAIHLLLNGIRDEIYSTVDACKTAHEMWIAIERLQQGESLNIQDVKTNLFWEFGKFTSHNGESIDFFNNFNQNGQVNEIRAERIAKNANLLALKKGKEIAKPITPPSESASKEDNDPEQAQRDKDMQKNLALITKYFKKIYKPTNNNIRTSSNSKNKNVDTFPRYKNDNQIGQLGNERTMTVAGVLGSTVGHFMVKIQKVPTVDLGTDTEPLEQVKYDPGYNVFANERQHSEQPESISNICVVAKVDSNVILDSPYMCDNDIQSDQNAEDELTALANLIENLKLDVDKNKKIQKQLKKTNTSLAHELKE